MTTENRSTTYTVRGIRKDFGSFKDAITAAIIDHDANFTRGSYQLPVVYARIEGKLVAVAECVSTRKNGKTARIAEWTELPARTNRSMIYLTYGDSSAWIASAELVDTIPAGDLCTVEQPIPAGVNARTNTHYWQHEMFGTITQIGDHEHMIAHGWIAISETDFMRILNLRLTTRRPVETPYERDLRTRLAQSQAEAAAYWAGSASAKGPRADITH